MDDKRGAALREDIFIESVEKDLVIHFPQDLPFVPGRRPDQTVIRALLPPVEKVAPESVLQATQSFNTSNDIYQGNPFTKVLKQLIREGFEAHRGEEDLRVLFTCQGQYRFEIRGMGIDVVNPADKIDLREMDSMLFGFLEQGIEGANLQVRDPPVPELGGRGKVDD